MNKNNNRSNLINLALIYNYLVNKSEMISGNVIKKYLKIINKYLEKNQKNKIPVHDNQENNSNYTYISYNNDEFIKLNIENIDIENLYYETIQHLDDYLMNISLYQGVLDVLGINREDLPIENYPERKQDTIDIHMTTNKEMAENVAKKYLIMKGMKEIQINGSILTHFDEDIGYRVYVTYDFLCEYLNIGKFSEYVTGFSKRLICNKN